ncbi:hypothetical protein ACR780_07330 [Sphingobacterium faecium]|uniref:hypothetical protein n=1 Tax=Sphingobacterium faecium TaxID=34087 RepID=UPI003DA20E91
MIFKKIDGNELYLYIDGNLVYKRWIDTGHSKVFDVMAYDKYTHTSIGDLNYENQNGLIVLNAILRLKSTEEGGRKTGIISGYRPNHVFEYTADGKIDQTYIGDIVFEESNEILPGEERCIIVRFLIHQRIENYLTKGTVWWIHEGQNQIGEAEIL